MNGTLIHDRDDGTILRVAPGLGVFPPNWAIYSADELHRYVLAVHWGEGGKMMAFIGLNPSTATENVLDPTLRRCVGFARAWGFSGLYMLNAFAYRSTDRSVLPHVDNPIGEQNDKYIGRVTDTVDLVVCAWGADGDLNGRQSDLQERLAGRDLHCLRMTKGGFPWHPLYLPQDLKPQIWKFSK